MAKDNAKDTKNMKTEIPTAKGKREKVRLVSTTIPGLWVRAFKDVLGNHVIKDPNGKPMVPGSPLRGGMSAEQRAALTAAKEAEKAKLAKMSDEEKLAYIAARRAERQAASAAKKAAERNALIAELKAEIAAGRL